MRRWLVDVLYSGITLRSLPPDGAQIDSYASFVNDFSICRAMCPTVKV